MTNADMSPEEGAQRRHRACEEDGDCFVHLRACLSSFMHDRITGKPFLDDEPVLICTKVIAFRLAAARYPGIILLSGVCDRLTVTGYPVGGPHLHGPL